jgi:hypothetical protein
VTVFALFLSVTISAASLAWGFSSVGFTSFAVWILILGAGWLLAVQQNWDWYSSFGLLFAVIAAAFGLWGKLPPGWMFSGGLFALFAWDMNDFRRRLRLVVKDENTRKMERRHIARISLLALAGLLLASITMLVRAEFTVEWMALLVLIVLLGLAQLVGWFRKMQ